MDLSDELRKHNEFQPSKRVRVRSIRRRKHKKRMQTMTDFEEMFSRTNELEPVEVLLEERTKSLRDDGAVDFDHEARFRRSSDEALNREALVPSPNSEDSDTSSFKSFRKLAARINTKDRNSRMNSKASGLSRATSEDFTVPEPRLNFELKDDTLHAMDSKDLSLKTSTIHTSPKQPSTLGFKDISFKTNDSTSGMMKDTGIGVLPTYRLLEVFAQRLFDNLTNPVGQYGPMDTMPEDMMQSLGDSALRTSCLEPLSRSCKAAAFIYKHRSQICRLLLERFETASKVDEQDNDKGQSQSNATREQPRVREWLAGLGIDQDLKEYPDVATMRIL